MHTTGAVLMSQRINISVPDDLYQQIQTFKDSLHLSRLCQEALLRAVAIEELRRQTEADIEKLAVVFQKEREAYGRDFWEEGFRDGMKDAFTTGYHSMYEIWMRSQTSYPPEDIFDLGASEHTHEKVERRNVGIEDGVHHEHASLDFDEFSHFYYEGWIAGFLDVWKRVCTKLSIHGFTAGKEAPHGDE
jgi:post-segregation antitoxin (ccd killing protein)